MEVAAPQPPAEPKASTPTRQRRVSTRSSAPTPTRKTRRSATRGKNPKETLRRILEDIPDTANLEVLHHIGEGTFSTVYLAHPRDDPTKPMAIKHLIPTSSPERIFTEVECLRISQGKANVVPVLFVHRKLADVVIGMPYIPTVKFGDLIKTIGLGEMKLYMKNLLIALAHIHSLGIIHRDIKPANFLYNRSTQQFSLCDFGLAQRMPRAKDIENTPTSKRKRDDQAAGSPAKRLRRGMNRPPLTCKTSTEVNSLDACSPCQAGQVTPTKKSVTPTNRPMGTPKKLLDKLTPEVRRSPRKHIGSYARNAKNYSKLMISGSTIVGSGATGSGSRLRKTPSFTMLDPASGIPSSSHATTTTFLPQASLTSHHSRGGGVFGGSHRFSTPTLLDIARCSCYGQPVVCSKCSSRRAQKAARAGTPGFRPIEVLLKHEHQTTAVDIWAAGVILLCMLSRAYPFFRAPDDMTALAEVTTLFGTNNVRMAAKSYGKNFICSENCPEVDLREVCTRLSLRSGDSESSVLATDEAIDLLKLLMHLESSKRITAEEALLHSFLQ